MSSLQHLFILNTLRSQIYWAIPLLLLSHYSLATSPVSPPILCTTTFSGKVGAFSSQNGNLVDTATLSSPTLHPSILYGIAVFDTAKFYPISENEVAVFRLQDHVNRLFSSAASMNLRITRSHEDVVSDILKLITETKFRTGFIRMNVLSRSDEKRLVLPESSETDLIINIWQAGSYHKTHESGEGIHVEINSQFIRPIHAVSTLKIAGNNYASSSFLRAEAAPRGINDIVFKDSNGNIAEATGQNIFVVKNGEVYTPKLGAILPGITRDTVLKLSSTLNISTHEMDINEAFLLQADEVFLTGTASEIVSVGKINGKTVGDGRMGSITRILADRYIEVVSGKTENENPTWLTRIAF